MMTTFGTGNEQASVTGVADQKEARSFVKSFSILVAGRAEKTVRDLVAHLARNKHYTVASRMITNGHADPLHNVEAHPDALVFVLSGAWEDELQSLADRPAAARPPSLIIGLEENPQAMRLAMRAGAREFLKWPEQLEEVKSALALIAGESVSATNSERADITTVINAKGGSGGTFVASSLAHMLVVRDQKKTALLDLELQFASLSSYFDMELKHGLMEALEAIPDMDETALAGYMTQHHSGLELLGTRGAMIGLSEEVDIDRFAALLELLTQSHDRLVIDTPRHLDQMTIHALENSDNVIVVLQQNLAALKDAIRLLAILRNELLVSKEKITVVVNRFDKNSDIRREDIKKALCVDDVLTLANDFSVVEESLNSGVPVYESAKKSKIAKSIIALSDKLEGKVSDNSGGLFASAASGVRRLFGADHTG